MSQEKVNKYKQEKAGRKKQLKKNKIKKVIATVSFTLIFIIVVTYIAVFPVLKEKFGWFETESSYQSSMTAEELSSYLNEQGYFETSYASEDSDTETTILTDEEVSDLIEDSTEDAE